MSPRNHHAHGAPTIAKVFVLVATAAAVTLAGISRGEVSSAAVGGTRLGTGSLATRGPLGRHARLAKGRLLVAGRELLEPNFFQSVVLLLEHGSKGTMGVVINRGSRIRLSTALPDVEELSGRTDTLYLGGPVARSQLLLLIRSRQEAEDSTHVFGDVYVSSRVTTLRQQLDEKGSARSFRVYVGHAGWAPGQLEAELAGGFWHVMRADAATVFDDAPAEIWPRLIRRAEEQLVIQARAGKATAGRDRQPPDA